MWPFAVNGVVIVEDDVRLRHTRVRVIAMQTLELTDGQIVNLIEQLPMERQRSIVEAPLMKGESDARWKRLLALMDEVGARNADKAQAEVESDIQSAIREVRAGRP